MIELRNIKDLFEHNLIKLLKNNYEISLSFSLLKFYALTFKSLPIYI
jgi:hypothetical protein